MIESGVIEGDKKWNYRSLDDSSDYRRWDEDREG